MLPPEVVAYYECGDEQTRLTARIGRLEWARTWILLQRYGSPGAPRAASRWCAGRGRCCSRRGGGSSTRGGDLRVVITTA